MIALPKKRDDSSEESHLGRNEKSETELQGWLSAEAGSKSSGRVGSLRERLRAGLGKLVNFEQSWAKKPRFDPEIISKERHEFCVEPDEEKVKTYPGKGYTMGIHNHPENCGFSLLATPSDGDFESFLRNDFRSSAIAQTNYDGSVAGYVVFRKPRNTKIIRKAISKTDKREEEYQTALLKMPEDTSSPLPGQHLRPPGFDDIHAEDPKITEDSLLFDDLRAYAMIREPAKDEEATGDKVITAMEEFCDKYGLRHRFVPMPGNKFSREKGKFIENN